MRALGLAAVMAWAGIAHAVAVRICAPSDANASDWDYLNGIFELYGSSARVRYGQSGYADGTPLAVGERLRCVAVASKTSTPTAEEKAAVIETVPLKVNLFGEVVPTGVLEGCMTVELGSLYSGTATAPSAVGVEGAPARGKVALTPISNLFDFVEQEPGETWSYSALKTDACAGKTFYLFLVAEDTRDAQGVPDPAADTCAGYTAFLVMKSLTEPIAIEDPDVLAAFAYSPYLLSGGTTPGFPDTTGYAFVQPVSAGETADGILDSASDGAVIAWAAARLGVDAATLTRADAERLLAPAVAGWTAAEGGLRLTLAEGEAEGVFINAEGHPLPSALRYTLYTADALDGPWEPLDEWAAKKNLANFGELSYTSLRLSELQSRVLPVAEDEKTRFYRLENAR